MSKPPILIPNAHERAAYGAIRSLGRDGYPTIAAFPPKATSSHNRHSRYITECLSSPDPIKHHLEFLSWLRDQLSTNATWIVLPINEGAVHAAATLRRHSVSPKRFILPIDDHLKFTLSKYHATKAAIAAGLDTPKTWFLREPGHIISPHNTDQVEFPAIIKWDNHLKADRQYAKGGNCVVSNKTELNDTLAELPSLNFGIIAQELVEGVGKGAFLIRSDSKYILQFTHKRLHEVPWHGGVSSLSTSTDDTTVLDAGKRFLDHIAYSGVGMVEFKCGATGPPLFMEVNGRFWGSIGLALHAGFDFPATLVRTQLGQTKEETSSTKPTAGIKCRNIAFELQHIRSLSKSQKHSKNTPPSRFWAYIDLLWNSIAPRTKSDLFWLDDPNPGLRALYRIWRNEISRAKNALLTIRRKRITKQIEFSRLRSGNDYASTWAKNPTSYILFLCYGNICRSPYAEYRWKKMRTETNALPICESAGFHFNTERKTPPRFQGAAQHRGINLKSHRSKRVSQELLDGAGLIIVMDHRNWNSLAEEFPTSTSKTVLLGGLDTPDAPEIQDPYDQPVPGGAISFERIDRALKVLSEHIKRASAAPKTDPREA